MSKRPPKSVSEMEVEGLGLVQPGLKVKHPVFGRGKVFKLAIFDSGERTIGVQFRSHGEKWLVPEYAKLEKSLW